MMLASVQRCVEPLNMALMLYGRHRKECEAAYAEDLLSGEFDETRRGWKKCGCSRRPTMRGLARIVFGRSLRLLEDDRAELSQELTPDEPAVCSGRSVERGVQTGFLRGRVKRLGPVECEIGGTGADPVMLYSAGIHPLQRVHVLLGVLAAGAPDCDPPEHPGIIVGRRGCMAAAHRQAGDGTALLICDHPEILLDKRNYFLHEAMRVGPDR